MHQRCTQNLGTRLGFHSRQAGGSLRYRVTGTGDPACTGYARLAPVQHPCPEIRASGYNASADILLPLLRGNCYLVGAKHVVFVTSVCPVLLLVTEPSGPAPEVATAPPGALVRALSTFLLLAASPRCGAGGSRLGAS